MFVLDTNVVSELRKIRTGKAHPNVAAWAAQQIPNHIYLSAITVHELELGVLLAERKDANKGKILRAWLNQIIQVGFEGRVLPINTKIAQISAQLNVPNPRPINDSLIAATAIFHSMTLVTRNTKDFADMGVAMLNPWET